MSARGHLRLVQPEETAPTAALDPDMAELADRLDENTLALLARISSKANRGTAAVKAAFEHGYRLGRNHGAELAEVSTKASRAFELGREYERRVGGAA